MSYYLGLSILSTNRAVSDSHRGEVGHQKLSAEARRILSLLDKRPLTENDFAREAQGRPFFPGHAVDGMLRAADSETYTLPKQQSQLVDFNIAHSGAIAAVSYVNGKNLRTGCDIERIRPRAKAREIAEEFFSSPERNYVFPQGGFDETRFYEIWTLKECYIKLRGQSVFDISTCPSFISVKGGDIPCGFSFDAATPAPLSFCLYELSDNLERYILAAALEGPEQQPPQIRWFSHLSLACKKTAEIKAALSPAETVSPKI